MTSHYKLKTFGQTIPSATHLSPMARSIAAGIGNGKPAPFAGLVWYCPQDVIEETLERAVAEHLQATRKVA